MFLTVAIHRAIEYAFYARGMWLPRQKELLTRVRDVDAELAALAAAFFATTVVRERFEVATQIVLRTSGGLRFFEWESRREDCSA